MIEGKSSENFLLCSQVKNQLASVSSFFFLYFSAKFYEFSFNPWCKTGWPPVNLDRVFELWLMFAELNRPVDSVLMRENTGRGKPVFRQVLRSVNKM